MNSIKTMRVVSITHDVSEVQIDGETQAFICRQLDPHFPVVVRLSGGYTLGEYDCNGCAAYAVAELESRVSNLNAKYRGTRGGRPSIDDDHLFNLIKELALDNWRSTISITTH